MSDLVPNLADLRDLLPPGEAGVDARTFLDRLSEAATVDEAVVKLDGLIDEWLAVTDE